MIKLNLKKNFALQAAIVSAALLASCNIFNPTGNGSSNGDRNAASLQDEAYSYYRNANYAKALEYFNKSIKEDSTHSESYLGAAKASMALNKINVFTLIGEVKDYDKEIPFISLKGDELKNNQKGITEALKYIRILHERDSLTLKYPLLHLSDRRLRYESVAAGHAVLESAVPFLNFGAKTEKFGKLFNKNNGKITADLSTVYDAVLKNPEMSEEFNEAIEELSNDLTEISSSTLERFERIIESSGIDISTDDNDQTSVSHALRNNIEQVQGTIISYKIRNSFDDDGDGCVDEEIFDYQDNDGDGLYDEDLRVTDIDRESDIPEDPDFRIIYKIYPDGIDHDMDGKIDSEDELTIDNDNHLLKFANEPGFFKSHGKKLDEAKSNVILDKDPNNIKYSLKWRQKNIGGCWTNYTEEMFMQWFEGRN